MNKQITISKNYLNPMFSMNQQRMNKLKFNVKSRKKKNYELKFLTGKIDWIFCTWRKHGKSIISAFLYKILISGFNVTW